MLLLLNDAENIRKEIILRYEGLSADEGEIPIEDLIDSLVGWRNYINLSTSIFLKKEFTTTPLEPKLRPQVNVKALSKSSFDVNIELIISVLALAVALKNDKHVDKLLTAFGKWIAGLFHKMVEEKKAFHTVIEVTNELQKFAADFEVKPNTDMLQSQKVSVEIDQALKKATKPIEHSANKIEVLSSELDVKLDVTVTEKRAIHNYFYFKEEKEGIFNARVIFDGVNLRTGHAGVMVHTCSDTLFKGSQTGYIKSESIKKPGNVFTGSLHKQDPIEIWVQPVRNAETGNIETWNFYDEYPKEDMPLFEIPATNK